LLENWTFGVLKVVTFGKNSNYFPTQPINHSTTQRGPNPGKPEQKNREAGWSENKPLLSLISTGFKKT